MGVRQNRRRFVSVRRLIVCRAISIIGGRLTRSGTRIIVRDIPEGAIFREISLIWETKDERWTLITKLHGLYAGHVDMDNVGQVRSRRGLFLALMALIMIPTLLTACTGAQGPAGPAGPAGPGGPAGPAGLVSVDLQPELLELLQGMAVTAPYLDEAKAIEAGYAATDDCVDSPAGAMGLHYMNLGLLPDGNINPSKPQVLLYIPTESGPKLAGFEYFMPLGPPGSPIPDPAPPAPTVAGRMFNGPMEGHDENMPPHYDLHIWAWMSNPDGIFEDFNPSLSCT